MSNYAYIYKKHRGQGHGTVNHTLRVDRAKALGYNYIICTVRGDNVREKAILNRDLWKQLTVFFNHEGETIEIWGKAI